MYQEDTREPRHFGFLIGMATGTMVGAGLMMWLAPRSSSELRQRVSDSARAFGQQASDHLQQTSTRVGEAVGQVTRTGQSVRNDVAGAFARGAHQVERFAKTVAADGV